MLNIWIGNLGKYNEGELIGDWIDLPKTKNEIKEFLKNTVRLDDEYEEYMINDYETDLPYKVDEYDNIYNLNLLAKMAEKIDDIEPLNAYIENQGDITFIELLNLIEQIDDIPYYSFSTKNEFMSPETKMGYEMADATGLLTTLENLNIENYFDFESYGESFEDGDIVILDNGYIDLSDSRFDLRKYSLQELKDIYEESNNDLNCSKQKVENKNKDNYR